MKRGAVVLTVLRFIDLAGCKGDRLMLTRRQAEEILRALSALPSEKVVEVQDFVLFLKEHYGHEKTVDESDVWTEEDLRDLTAAVLNHADRTV